MATAAGVGLSTREDASAAARQAARAALDRAGISAADWALVFATAAHRPHYAALLAETHKVLGTDTISGCSAWGVLSGAEEIEGRPGVAILAVRSDRIGADATVGPIGADQEADTTLRAVARSNIPEAGVLVLLPDPLVAPPDRLLGTLNRMVPGIEAVGGAASGDPRLDGTFQFCGRNVATRALAALRLSGGCRSFVGITQGCQPIGAACRVTKGEGSVILELDGRPALEVLRSRLPAILRDALERLGTHLFIGVPPDPEQDSIEPGEYLVRGLIGADAGSGALAVGAEIRQGQPVLLVLREAHSAREDLKQMLGRLPRPAGAYRFGFYFNCAARGSSLYGLPGIDTAFISGALGDLPIIGFFGNAEIAPLRGATRLFTHTGVLALVSEA
jgi:small ligand-binding sensory domain FIST